MPAVLKGVRTFCSLVQAECARRRAEHEQKQLELRKQGEKDGKPVSEAGPWHLY